MALSRVCKLILLLLLPGALLAQEDELLEKEAAMRSFIWLKILDVPNSPFFEMEKAGLGDLPVTFEYRGVIVEAVHWLDSNGENIVVLTQTGGFNASKKDYEKDGVTARCEVHAYLLNRADSNAEYSLLWKLNDYEKCIGVDMYAGFDTRSMTITDWDEDGLAEVCVIYTLSCRGGVDPAIKKLILYEGREKYAMRGKTHIPTEPLHISEGHPDDKLKGAPKFLEFAKERWELFKEDEFRQFR